MYLFGASGHGKVIAEIAEELKIEITAFIDDDKTKPSLIGYQVLHKIPENNIETVISVGNNKTRKSIVKANPNLKYLSLTHPKATVSKRNIIGEGTVIMTGVTINSGTKIGKHCIVNTNSSVDHDCILEDYVHISPNAALAGNVFIGEGTHIGIGASIIQCIKIGKWCTIGAGAVIIRDVPDGATVVGNPGRVIKIKEEYQ